MGGRLHCHARLFRRTGMGGSISCGGDSICLRHLRLRHFRLLQSTMGGLLHCHPRLHHLSLSRRENWAMGGWGGSFYGGATLFCFEIWWVSSSANLWGGYAIEKKQSTGATSSVFVGLAPGLSYHLPLAILLHLSTSLGRSDGGGYVFLSFGLLVFWFLCWFPCSSLSGKDGGC